MSYHRCVLTLSHVTYCRLAAPRRASQYAPQADGIRTAKAHILNSQPGDLLL